MGDPQERLSIPGIDGLIHISQIANKRIDKPSDVLSVGQEVDVKITGIDFDKKRVSLSMRALLPEDEQAPVKAAVEAEETEEAAEPEEAVEAVEAAEPEEVVEAVEAVEPEEAADAE